MTTTTRYYAATDSGAPVLTGQVGALSDLLKKLLYGDGSGVAYGTGGSQKLAAGWGLAFTATNRVSLRNSLAVGGTGCYIQVDDTASGTAGAKEGFIRSYGAMTAIGTGTDPAPTTTQRSLGCIVRKSTTADSTARFWHCAADERTFYLGVHSGDASNVSSPAYETSVYYGGDFESFLAGDGYAYGAAGRASQNVATGGGGIMQCSNSFLAGSDGIFVGRGYAGTGTALQAAMSAAGYPPQADFGDSNWAPTNPDPAGNEIWVPQVLIHDSGVRGRMRGIYIPLNQLNGIPSGTVRSSVPGLPSGHAITIFRGAGRVTSGSNPGGIGIETALSW